MVRRVSAAAAAMLGLWFSSPSVYPNSALSAGTCGDGKRGSSGLFSAPVLRFEEFQKEVTSDRRDPVPEGLRRRRSIVAHGMGSSIRASDRPRGRETMPRPVRSTHGAAVDNPPSPCRDPVRAAMVAAPFERRGADRRPFAHRSERCRRLCREAVRKIVGGHCLRFRQRNQHPADVPVARDLSAWPLPTSSRHCYPARVRSLDGSDFSSIAPHGTEAAFPPGTSP